MKKAVLPSFLLAIVSAAEVGSTAELPVETFFRHYQYYLAELSPDGSCFAALAPSKHHMGVVVVDLDKRQAHWAYADRGADVSWFAWANTNRLLFGFSKDGYAHGGMMAANRDGSKRAALVPFDDSRTTLLATLPDTPNEILVQSIAYSDRDPATGLS